MMTRKLTHEDWLRLILWALLGFGTGMAILCTYAFTVGFLTALLTRLGQAAWLNTILCAALMLLGIGWLIVIYTICLRLMRRDLRLLISYDAGLMFCAILVLTAIIPTPVVRVWLLIV